MKEEAIRFGKATTLVGIITHPAEADLDVTRPGVILLNSGILHRVGPNRLYVEMARRLATMGFVVLRFDFSGIGDSPVRNDHLPFDKSAVSEAGAAMNHLETVKGIDRFILAGICSGAAISFKMACQDPRVIGAFLINPRNHLHDRTNDTLSSSIRNRTLARHYWRIAFSSSFNRKNQLKAITGKVDYRTIGRVVLNFGLGHLLRAGRRMPSGANGGEADLRLLAERGTHLMHVYSEGDEGLDYLHVMLGDRLETWHARGLLKLEIVGGANHTFTLLWSQERLLEILCHWAEGTNVP